MDIVESVPAERLITPPPRKPVQEYLTPNLGDGYYTELCDRLDPAFDNRQPIARGTPYASMQGAKQSVIDAYPGGLWFCKAVKPGNSAEYGNTDQWLILIWATDFLAESQSNAELDYLENAVTFPAFIRAYTVRRDVYEASSPITPGTALTALLSVAITAGGTGYTAATGTVGNATVAFVCSAGAIISGVVTKEGSGIAANAAITITGDGTGATATARIQPASAVLLSQKKLEFPDDSTLAHEFVRVLRVYETLPGPTITSSKYDPASNTFIETAKTKKQRSTITEGIAIVAGEMVVTVADPIDAFTAWELVTTYPESPYHSLATAIIEEKVRPYQFPARFDWDNFLVYAVPIGYRKPFATLVPHFINTFYVNSITKPDISADLDGITFGDTIYANNGFNFENAIHDEVTVDYTVGGMVTFPATDPSYTDFTADWIGTLRAIDGSVEMAGSPYRWKCEIITLIML